MEYVQVLAPTIVVALIFWFVVRTLFRVDRNERLAEAEVERNASRSGEAVSGAEPDDSSTDHQKNE
ncbi:hypothetical protein [Zhihengliuella flava]|uniref:Flagellar biosynthesis/type III secretory pathway M-ring protein FliF/YscJ n=1 Tax=Zhihengliuella flava TaxID=1285193 RepID=A0A931D5K2_9MICC|nr:flagellar biosynthesis/type III secretory pathway M-ring protein FliF/YscJ [Zhihengliuella flava]